MKKTTLFLLMLFVLALSASAARKWTNNYPLPYADYPYYAQSKIEQPPGVRTPLTGTNQPSVAYPYSGAGYQVLYSGPFNPPPASENQLCGLTNNQQFGCSLGMVCDYTRTPIKNVGICTKQKPYSTSRYVAPYIYQ